MECKDLVRLKCPDRRRQLCRFALRKASRQHPLVHMTAELLVYHYKISGLSEFIAYKQLALSAKSLEPQTQYTPSYINTFEAFFPTRNSFGELSLRS